MVALLWMFLLVLGTAIGNPFFGKQTRIIGGSAAPDGQYPYQVSLRRKDFKHFCGGSIISDHWILTAAHCTYGSTAADIIAAVGSNLLSSGGGGYYISEIHEHPQYVNATQTNDIALLKTRSQINYNPKVQPIALGDSDPSAGSRCNFSGWGFTDWPPFMPPNDLQHIVLNVITNEQCQELYSKRQITSAHVCTLNGPGEGTCPGDSGGPLVCNGKQVGVASFGIPCGLGWPDVFSSIKHFREFIRSKSGV